MPERFVRPGLGLVGHIGKLPAVAIVLDLLEDRLLVVQGGKSPHWVSFDDFTMDPRGMKTGEDLGKEDRGW